MTKDDEVDMTAAYLWGRAEANDELKRLRAALALIDKMGGKPWELTNGDAIAMVMIARSALFDLTIVEDA